MALLARAVRDNSHEKISHPFFYFHNNICSDASDRNQSSVSSSIVKCQLKSQGNSLEHRERWQIVPLGLKWHCVISKDLSLL